MRPRSVLWILVVLAVTGFSGLYAVCLTGCAPSKREPPKSAVVSGPSSLPRLRQNKVNATARPAAWKDPDFSFQDVPDPLEKIPEEDANALAPRAD